MARTAAAEVPPASVFAGAGAGGSHFRHRPAATLAAMSNEDVAAEIRQLASRWESEGAPLDGPKWVQIQSLFDQLTPRPRGPLPSLEAIEGKLGSEALPSVRRRLVEEHLAAVLNPPDHDG